MITVEASSLQEFPGFAKRISTPSGFHWTLSELKRDREDEILFGDYRVAETGETVRVFGRILEVS